MVMFIFQTASHLVRSHGGVVNFVRSEHSAVTWSCSALPIWRRRLDFLTKSVTASGKAFFVFKRDAIPCFAVDDHFGYAGERHSGYDGGFATGRLPDVFADPAPWSPDKDGVFSRMSTSSK